MKKVLLIDDDKFLVRVFLVKLNKEGVEPTFLENGTEAMNLLVTGEYGLVVVDLVMSDYDGYKVIEQIRSDARTSGIPIIVVTAIHSDEDKEKCIKLGATEYFVKGDVAFSRVIESIKKYIV